MISLVDPPQAIHVNALVVSTLIGTVIPILVGLASKGSWKWKGMAMIILNAVQAAVVKSVVPDGGAVFTAQTIIAAVLGVFASTAAYEHLWTNVGLVSTTDDAGQPVGKLAPTKGLG